MLSNNNATIICTDKNVNKAIETTQLIQKMVRDCNIVSYQMDVTDSEQVANVIDQVYNLFGRIDFLFNNAGVAISGEIRNFKEKHWNNVINVNLLGLIRCTTEVYQRMCLVKSGHIINITSISGLLQHTALSTPYAVSKHGAVIFSKSLALEAKDYNINVSIICPGTVKTDIIDHMDFIKSNDQMIEKAKEFIRKGIDPIDAAEQILKATAQKRELVIFPKPFKRFFWYTKIAEGLWKNMNLNN